MASPASAHDSPLPPSSPIPTTTGTPSSATVEDEQDILRDLTNEQIQDIINAVPTPYAHSAQLYRDGENGGGLALSLTESTPHQTGTRTEKR